MHQYGRAGVLVELAQSADMVYVRVRADDGFHGKAPPSEQIQNARDFVAGIDDESFARQRVADDRTIALQHADGDSDVNQAFLSGIEGRQASQVVTHEAIIASDGAAPSSLRGHN